MFLMKTQVNDQTEDQPAEIAYPTQDHPILSRLPTGSDLRQGQLISNSVSKTLRANRTAGPITAAFKLGHYRKGNVLM